MLYAFGAVVPTQQGGVWVFVAATAAEEDKAAELLSTIVDTIRAPRMTDAATTSTAAHGANDGESDSSLMIIGLVAAAIVGAGALAILVFTTRNKSTPAYAQQPINQQYGQNPYGQPAATDQPNAEQQPMPPPNPSQNTAHKAPWEL
ncbi:MAG: hypothetical protein ACYTDT_12740 [Planctomycetota bacterium]|jgi:hypothetical protein